MTADAAALPRCPVCRFRELPGPGYVCGHCTDHLADDLREIARRADELDARPGVAGSDGGRGAPGFSSKPPGRVNVWVARDRRSKPYPVVEEWRGRDRHGIDNSAVHHEDDRPVRGVWWTLSSWAQLIAESRGFTHPPPSDVAELCSWIGNQADYIARWPDDGPALCRDLRAQRNQLRTLTGDPNPRPAAYCIRLVEHDDGPPTTCGEPIFLPRGTSQIDHTQPVKLFCAAPDPHTYSGLDLLRLKHANDGEAGCT